MFRVKICGITTGEQARAAAAAGADAVGLNLYPGSPRFLPPAAAATVAAAVPKGVQRVGLFVNAALSEMLAAWSDLGLDIIQLHGDEPPDLVAALGDRPVVRAFRVGAGGLATVFAYLAACRTAGHLPRMALLDAFRPGCYGGTGARVDWSEAAGYPAESWHPPLVLAGGLTPENVAGAICAVRPRAVDTASGVESAPGRKDPARVAAFCRAARTALAALDS